MKVFTKEDLKILLSATESPCISLYQPTHRHFPDNQQDVIRFGNLLKELEESMGDKFGADEVSNLLNPLEKLKTDTEFWNHALDGLAIFRSRNLFEVFRLQKELGEIAVVSDSFHLKPLKKYLQTVDHYQLLCLSRDSVKLYEGNRHHLDEVALNEAVPTTMRQALGRELTEGHLTAAVHNGPGGATIHGYGSRKDEIGVDTERFFRAVDRAIAEHHSKPSDVPLVLAALPEYHSVFQSLSHNPMLVEKGVMIDPASLDAEELRQRSWEVFEPKYLESLENVAEEYNLASSKALGADDLQEAFKAATASRISKLLVEEGRIVPGRVVDESGGIVQDELANPEVDDLLDDLGELVLEMGGQVLVIPSEKMPTDTGLAAIYRY